MPEIDAPYADIIERVAAEHKLDPKLIQAVIEAESNFRADTVSPVGAKGLMQLMDTTAKELGVVDPFDPEQNIRGGVKYLRQLIDRFDGNIAMALAGYNAGPTRVAKLGRIPNIPETKKYVVKIHNRYRELREQPPPQGLPTAILPTSSALRSTGRFTMSLPKRCLRPFLKVGFSSGR